jgi:uncharacterized membrane protein HdeD (DUF308 family)
MSDLPYGDGIFHRRLRDSANRLRWFGIALLVLGIAAILFPVFSTLLATVFVGWLLLIFGIMAFIHSFSIHGAGPFFGALLLSLLSTAAGIFLVTHPPAGALALTLLLGMVFMVQGAVELSFALEMRPMPGWGGMLASGIASIVMALLIIATWPGISMIVLGILVGVNFISSGMSFIFMTRAMQS